MAGEILKTIKINVSSAEYRALLASLDKILDYEKRIAKVQTESTTEYKLKKKLLEEKLAALRAEIALNRGLGSMSFEQTKLAEIQVNRQLQLLKINRKLYAEKKRAAQDERNAALKAKQDEISNRPMERLKQFTRAKAEEGQEPGIAKGLRYSSMGISAPWAIKAERAQEEGDRAVAAFDEQIAQKRDQQEANQAEMDKLLGDLGDPSNKMTKAQRQAAEARITTLKAENAALDTDVENLQDQRSEKIGETKTQVSKYQATGEAAKKMAGQLKKVAGVLLAPFKKLAGAAMDATKQLLDFKTGVATFSTQNSLITNSSAREQMMKYGLTASQNYAFTQAKSMLGIESDEDLMYMNSAQRDKLLDYMGRYSAWYDQLESSGVLADIQEMQLEFKEFAQQIAMEFLHWVAANKESIMAMIKGMFEFLKAIANVVMGIMNLLSWGKYKSGSSYSVGAASDSTNNNYNNNQRNTVINVTANTTNNATGVLSSQEALDQYNKENFSKLAKQLATAIGG